MPTPLFPYLPEDSVSGVAVCDPHNDAQIASLSANATYAAVKHAAHSAGYDGPSVKVYALNAEDGNRIAHSAYDITIRHEQQNGFRTAAGNLVGPSDAAAAPQRLEQSGLDFARELMMRQARTDERMTDATRTAYEAAIARIEAESTNERIRLQGDLRELRRELEVSRERLEMIQQRHAEQLRAVIEQATEQADVRVERIRDDEADRYERLDARRRDEIADLRAAHERALAKKDAERDADVGRVERRLKDDVRELRDELERSKDRRRELETEVERLRRALSEAESEVKRLRSTKFADAESRVAMMRAVSSTEDEATRNALMRVYAAEHGVELPEQSDDQIGKWLELAAQFLSTQRAQQSAGGAARANTAQAANNQGNSAFKGGANAALSTPDAILSNADTDL